MNTVTSSIITSIFVVVITSSMLGARAPDVEAEKEITDSTGFSGKSLTY